MKTENIENCVLNSLMPGINDAGNFGCRRVDTAEERWATLVAIAEAAAKAAESDWILNKRAGRPQSSGASIMDTRERAPYAGFHLSIQRWESSDEVDNPVLVWNGRGYPLTKKGLSDALDKAEDVTYQDDTNQVTVSVSWAEFLPGRGKDFIADLYHR